MAIKYETFPHLEEKLGDLEDETLKENNWCNLAERLFVESGELRYGQTARVYDTTVGSRICLKRLDQKEARKYPYMNSLKEEASYLQDVANLIEEGDGVIVPKPLMVINSAKRQEVTKQNLKGEMVTFHENVKEDVLVMEKIEGASLEDIFNPKEPRFKKEVPSGIEWNSFLDTLETFVHKMNKAGFYHRDLHMGNVMIDSETLQPVIIDFGFSRKQFSEDNDVYTEVVSDQVSTRFKSDIERISDMRKVILGA